MVLETLIFFFSSRRRHTRYWRDWSSDVCSSDLDAVSADLAAPVGAHKLAKQVRGLVGEGLDILVANAGISRPATIEETRSEERRVGKECRSRWSPYH